MPRAIEIQRNELVDPVNPHGDPLLQWSELQGSKVSLAIAMPFTDWTQATRGVPDLRLAHYLACRHIFYSYPIPHKVKDAVVIGAPPWVQDSLNLWNRDTAHLRRQYVPLVDPLVIARKNEPLRAIAASASHKYIACNQHSPGLDAMVTVLLDMVLDTRFMEATEAFSSNVFVSTGDINSPLS